MAEAHEIVSQVLEAFKGLPVSLERLFQRKAELWRSHARTPKSRDALASGNVSPVTHFIQYCRQYQAAAAGAGLMLAERVAAELALEFAPDSSVCDKSEMIEGVLKESYDVLRELNDCNFEDASTGDLSKIETECQQLAEKAQDVRAHIRAIKRIRENGRK